MADRAPTHASPLFCSCVNLILMRLLALNFVDASLLFPSSVVSKVIEFGLIDLQSFHMSHPTISHYSNDAQNQLVLI